MDSIHTVWTFNLQYRLGSMHQRRRPRPTTNYQRAAVYREFGGPIRIENHVPIPNIPSDGILIQVCATGVCRSDWHGWKGHDDDIHQHGLPFIPGHELSGIVVELGPGVASATSRDFDLGDRVTVPFILSCGSCRYCHQSLSTVCSRQVQPGFTYWGSFAEYVVIPRAIRNVRKIPEGVSFVQAAALGCRFTTAYRAVQQQGRLRAGETIAIFGAGGLGLSCIMIAASLGASKIIAVDVSKEALDLASQNGATHTVHVTKTTSDQDNLSLRGEVIRLCCDDFDKEEDGGPGGADVCVDAAGFPETCENAVHCTRPAGRMVQVGLPIGHKPPIVPMGRVAGKEIEIIGSHGFAVDDLPALLQLIAEGKLDPAQLVSKEVSLEEGAKELEMMDQRSPVGMTMITRFRDSKL